MRITIIRMSKYNPHHTITVASVRRVGGTVARRVIADHSDAARTFATHGKHGGELKGFAMALQAGGKDLGVTAVKLNRLLGYGPVLLGGSQVVGVNRDGSDEIGESVTLSAYMVNMLKVQQLMVDAFGVTARQNDSLAAKIRANRYKCDVVRAGRSRRAAAALFAGIKPTLRRPKARNSQRWYPADYYVRPLLGGTSRSCVCV